MPRSIWNGVISFGMVSIPVKLYTATESKDVSFNLLHSQARASLHRFLSHMSRNIAEIANTGERHYNLCELPSFW